MLINLFLTGNEFLDKSFQHNSEQSLRQNH